MVIFRITEKDGKVTYVRGPIEGIDLFNKDEDKSFHFVDDEGNFHMWPLDIIKEINFIGLYLGRKKVKDEVYYMWWQPDMLYHKTISCAG